MTEDPDNFSPQTLVQIGLAKAGDRDAFGEVLARYGCRVRHWIRAAGNLQDHDLDELTQEVNVKILRHLERAEFADVGGFRAWVKRICTTTTLNFLRSRRRDPVQGHLESRTPAETSYGPAAPGRSPASEAGAREMVSVRDRRIAELPPNDRWLIEARERQGLQFRDIAARLSDRLREQGQEKRVSEDAVRVKYKRLLKQIGDPAA